MIDQQVGQFRITALLGKGGMGEVYRAEDLRLGREVAIKVLPPEVADDRARMARFETEARSLAALNHPNVAGVYGIEQHGERSLLVMELADGEDLSVRIGRGALPLDEALDLARQIAAGLEAAHARGIVHRDLKPANVKVLPDGTVKVLDFGLAKAFGDEPGVGGEPDLTSSPTQLLAQTREGTILGTAAYMSPEQARGRAVDWRTDIWAFGCVLYEMLTGRAAFAEPTVADTLAAVIHRDPDLGALPPGAPPALRDLMRRLLTRDVRSRLQAVGDARIILEECQSGASTAIAATPPRSRRAWLAVGVVAAALAVSAAATWWLAGARGAAARQAPELRLRLPLPAEHPLSYFGGSPLGLEFTALDLSRDGTRLVYLSQTPAFDGVVALDLASGRAQALAGTAGAYLPRFSPDGASVAFLADGMLKRVPYAGGGVDVLSPAPDSSDLLWSRDGNLYWIANQGMSLRRMRPALGAPVETVVEPCSGCRSVADGLEPGELLLRDSNQLVRLRSGGERIPLDIPSSDVRLQDDGSLLFTGSGRLMVTRLSSGGEASGPAPRTVLTGLRTATTGAGQYALSRNGTLVYAAGGDAGLAYLVRRDVDGQVSRLPFAAAAYGAMDALPDGSRIAILAGADGGTRIRVLDTASGTVQFIDPGAHPTGLTWEPDGSHLVAATVRDGKWRIVEHTVDSAAEPAELLSAPHRLYPGDWSRDGRFLLLGEIDGAKSWVSVWDRRERSLTHLTAPTTGLVWSPTFSPDGRFVAYTAIGATGSQVYVIPFPTGDKLWLVSAGGRGAAVAGRQPGARVSPRARLVRGHLPQRRRRPRFQLRGPEAPLPGALPQHRRHGVPGPGGRQHDPAGVGDPRAGRRPPRGDRQLAPGRVRRSEARSGPGRQTLRLPFVVASVPGTGSLRHPGVERRGGVLAAFRGQVQAVALVAVATLTAGHMAGAKGIAPLSFQVVADVALPGGATRMDYISVDHASHRAYLAHMGDGTVVAVDTSAAKVSGVVAGTPTVRGVLAVPDRNLVYAAAAGSGEIVVIDADTLQVEARIPAGNVDGLAYVPDSKRLFVTDQHGGNCVVIDTATNTVVQRIAVGGDLGNTRFEPVTGDILEAVGASNELVAIDPRSLAVTGRWPLPGVKGAHGVAIDSSTATAFVAGEENASVCAFSLREHREKAIASVGEGVDVLDVDPGTHRLYVASESGVVSVFDVTRGGLQKLEQGHFARDAHVVGVDAATHLLYFPLQDVAGRPVLRIVRYRGP